MNNDQSLNNIIGSGIKKNFKNFLKALKKMLEEINVLNYPDHELNIREPTLIDESIESEQYFDYEPQSQNNLDTTNVIQIDINVNDTYAIPSKSLY